MDDADLAQERIEQTVADGIRKASNAQGLKPNGFCIWCAEPVRQNYLFCSSECSLDFHKEQRIRSIAGRK